MLYVLNCTDTLGSKVIIGDEWAHTYDMISFVFVPIFGQRAKPVHFVRDVAFLLGPAVNTTATKQGAGLDLAVHESCTRGNQNRSWPKTLHLFLN